MEREPKKLANPDHLPGSMDGEEDPFFDVETDEPAGEDGDDNAVEMPPKEEA